MDLETAVKFVFFEEEAAFRSSQMIMVSFSDGYFCLATVFSSFLIADGTLEHPSADGILL